MLVEPLLDGFEDMFVLPARDTALLACGAECLDGAVRADARPVAAYSQSCLFARVAVGQAFPGGTDVDILIGNVAEVLLAEAAFGRAVRGLRFGQGDGDTRLLAG